VHPGHTPVARPRPSAAASAACATRVRLEGSPAPLKRRGAEIRHCPLPPPPRTFFGIVRAREPPEGSHRPPSPQRFGSGPAISELRLGGNEFTGIGIAGMVRDARDLEGNHKAHGRNERQVAGNGDMTQRIRQRSKALKSAASRDSDEPCPAPPRWDDGAHGASTASAVEPPRTPFGRPEAVFRCDPRERACSWR
jgi:hypothetical protein